MVARDNDDDDDDNGDGDDDDDYNNRDFRGLDRSASKWLLAGRNVIPRLDNLPGPDVPAKRPPFSLITSIQPPTPCTPGIMMTRWCDSWSLFVNGYRYGDERK